jgi:hypothetical protein
MGVGVTNSEQSEPKVIIVIPLALIIINNVINNQHYVN